MDCKSHQTILFMGNLKNSILIGCKKMIKQTVNFEQFYVKFNWIVFGFSEQLHQKTSKLWLC